MLTVTITKNGTNDMKVRGHSSAGELIRTQYGRSEDSGAIAAAAINMAQQYGRGKYVIVGPNDVMSHIPESLRSKS